MLHTAEDNIPPIGAGEFRDRLLGDLVVGDADSPVLEPIAE
jgi:hypothetical protein